VKIKAVAVLCKKDQMIRLCDMYEDDDHVTQWVGDGSALYPLHGLPHLETETICTIFDFSEKDISNSIIRHTRPPEGLNFNDMEPGEILLKPPTISLVIAGKILKPLQTSQGVVFIDSQYLSPLADILKSRSLRLYERTSENGEIYIAAKNGLLLAGIIIPTNIINDAFLEQIELLARQCRVSYEKDEAAKAAAAADQPQQQSFALDGTPYDPATGEVIAEDEAEESPGEVEDHASA
jgi:hypothetical protein